MRAPRVFNVHPLPDHPTIKVLFDIETACGLIVRDWMLHVGRNGPWISPQGIPQIDEDGRHRSIGGKRQYTCNIAFSDDFKAAVLAHLREAGDAGLF